MTQTNDASGGEAARTARNEQILADKALCGHGEYLNATIVGVFFLYFGTAKGFRNIYLFHENLSRKQCSVQSSFWRHGLSILLLHFHEFLEVKQCYCLIFSVHKGLQSSCIFT